MIAENRSPLRQRALPALAGLALVALLSTHAAAQVPGASREEMWYAPTAEDWAKPCLITWQRTWGDAVSVSRATGKPILVCVNMDGEIASEHYAGIRYRQPEIAALYEPYVCVIASVYRHTPRDHDERGNRIPCPRFGAVTCGEHIAIEPGLFEQYFEDTRVAPRHVMIELDQSETYDVYYALDTDSVFQTIREGIEQREVQPLPDVRGDVALIDRVSSRDVRDRVAVEVAYVQSSREDRRALLEAALANPDAAPVELLRLALFGFDLELARLARKALAATSDESAIDLILEALRVPMDAAEREALIAALDRIGESSERARTLAIVQRGLTGKATVVDVDGWSSALASGPADRSALTSRLEYQVQAAATRPADGAARLAVAEAFLDLALDPGAEQAYAELLLEDARRVALEAESLGAEGWGVDATLAVVAREGGDVEEAHRRAEAALAAMPASAEAGGAGGRASLAVLELFVEARQAEIRAAVREKRRWPGEWLSDLEAAHGLLRGHPLATDVHAASHHDFLRWLGAFRKSSVVLDEALARYPDSALLHDRLRGRILRERGIGGLESAYDALLAEEDASPYLPWYAGYASLVAAEFYRRETRREEALSAYERAIARYDLLAASEPVYADSASHWVAMARAGRARVLLDLGEDDRALEEVLASFARREWSAASLDGLNVNAVGTARLILQRLAEAGRADQAARLQAALDALDPSLLVLPAFERGRR